MWAESKAGGPLLPAPACRESRHAAKGATLRLANASSARFPLWNPLRQNFTANRALGAQLLAHNLPQNFPVGVAVVGACPPTATDLNFFDSLGPAERNLSVRRGFFATCEKCEKTMEVPLTGAENGGIILFVSELNKLAFCAQSGVRVTWKRTAARGLTSFRTS